MYHFFTPCNSHPDIRSYNGGHSFDMLEVSKNANAFSLDMVRTTELLQYYRTTCKINLFIKLLWHFLVSLVQMVAGKEKANIVSNCIYYECIVETYIRATNVTFMWLPYNILTQL